MDRRREGRAGGRAIVRARRGPPTPRLRAAPSTGQAGMSLEQAARELEASPSKISRLENGQSPAKLWDVRNLLTLYEVDDHDYRRRVERWVSEGKAQGWWLPYSDAIPTDLDHYLSLEAEASVIRHYSAPFLHGVLQTEPYARAFFSSALPGLDDPGLERLVRLRMMRKQIFSRTGSCRA